MYLQADKQNVSLFKKATIHQATAMLATLKNVIFPGHNYLLTTDTDDPPLIVQAPASEGSSVPVVSR